jgi:hypothetical protein
VRVDIFWVLFVERQDRNLRYGIYATRKEGDAWLARVWVYL